MSDSVFAFLSGLPMEWIVFLASAIPITELRLSIPFGILNHLSPWMAWVLGVLGNMLPIPFLIWLWPTVYKICDKFSFTRKFLHKYVDKARAKGHQIEKYGALGLMLFVAIPLPGTGVYTGSLAAYILGLNRFYSFLSLSAGAIVAGVLVTLATVGFVGVAEALGGVVAVIFVAVIVIVGYWFHRRNKRRKAEKK